MSDKNTDPFHTARMGGTAFVVSLGGEIVDVGKGRARTRGFAAMLDHLVGDPKIRASSMAGSSRPCSTRTCGIAVASALKEIMPFATLDLRIDYMGSATPHCRILMSRAECLKVTHEVAFTRGIAYQTSRDEPIALSTGAFMLIRGDRDTKQAG